MNSKVDYFIKKLTLKKLNPKTLITKKNPQIKVPKS